MADDDGVPPVRGADDDVAWGWMDGETFRPVPKAPLKAADLVPPCTVQLHCGTREIIRDPRREERPDVPEGVSRTPGPGPGPDAIPGQICGKPAIPGPA